MKTPPAMKTSQTLFEITRRDPAADKAAIAARLEAYRDRLPGLAPELILPNAQAAAGDSGLPEISATAFSAEALGNALKTQGSLLVRGLFTREAAAPMLPVIDGVLDACERNAAGATLPQGPCFNPPDNLDSIMPRGARELGNTRNFHRESGSAMCIEAPSVAEALLQWYEEMGLRTVLEQYLGEPPCLSAKKWVLRRSKLPVAEAGWHQDGAFMGTDINSVNLWIPLNECGGDTGAPGLDVLPRRLHEIQSAEGAQFDWSVSSTQVANQSGENAVLSPVFQAGDAFFFDHLFLHRTQYGAQFTRPRYAVETWFFGASRFPKNQIPLAW